MQLPRFRSSDGLSELSLVSDVHWLLYLQDCSTSMTRSRQNVATSFLGVATTKTWIRVLCAPSFSLRPPVSTGRRHSRRPPTPVRGFSLTALTSTVTNSARYWPP